MKKLFILPILIGIMMVGLVAAAETNFTEGEMGGFNTAVINLLSVFTILIPIIIGFAILFFFMRGGEYGVNPVAVLLIGGIAVLISIFIVPPVIESIIATIWR